MTTYNTGNPIGSKDPRDLYDNAENLDEAVNTRTSESWDDRFGVSRKTWWGMEQDFQQFLINSGYENIGDYGPGLEITARNQIFWRDGELYRAGAALELPYTTTGDWGVEESLFVAVGDQALRQDLANPTMGAAIVSYGEGTVADTLNSQAASIEKISSNYSTKPTGTILRSTIEQGIRDAQVIVLGDSTGVGEERFVGICARKLAEKYPTHSVELYLWDEAATTWGSAISVSTGSGSRTIRIYNGSVSGAVATYWTRWGGYLYPGSGVMSSVIVNFGLNQAESVQESAALSSIMDLRDRYGYAFDIVPIIQNPDYDLPDRSAARMEAQQRVYRAFGLDPVDSFSLFTDLVNNHGGVTAWLPDGLHPNAAGQEKLAELVFERLLNSTSAPVFPKSAPTAIPNGNFLRWPNGFGSPLFWSTGRGAVSAYDSGESGRAVKVLGGTESLSGYISVPLSGIDKFNWCPYVYISARLRTTGAGADVGVLEVVRAEDNEVVRSAPYVYGEAGVESPFRWAVLHLPRDFLWGKTGVELRVMSGLSSQGNEVIIDQVSLGSGPVPCVSDGSDSSQFITVPHHVGPVSVGANSSLRTQIDEVPGAQKGVNVTISAPELPLGIVLSAWGADTAGSVIVQFNNVTAEAISVPQTTAVITID